MTGAAVPPVPPPTDPEGRYRTLPTGTRRTSVWFGVVGAAALVLGLPFALPVDRDTVDGNYPTLDDAAVDTVLTWGSWAPDLSGLDAVCSAPRMQPGMASLYAECGTAVIDLVGTEGVDADASDADLARTADRAVRAAWGQDQDPMEFVPASAGDLLDPALSGEVTSLQVSGTFEYLVDDGGEDWSPDDGYGGFSPGGGIQDVKLPVDGSRVVSRSGSGDVSRGVVRGVAREVAQPGYVPASTYSLYSQAAAFVGPEDVMYTLVVSGDSPSQVNDRLTDLLRRMR